MQSFVCQNNHFVQYPGARNQWRLISVSVMWSRALRWYTDGRLRSRPTGADVTGKPAGRPTRYFRSPVVSGPKRPPTSGVWLLVVGTKWWIWSFDATRRNITLQYVWCASASLGHCQYRYQGHADFTGLTEQPSISSGEVGNWCWRRAVTHHRTVFSGLGCSLLDLIQDVVASTHSDTLVMKVVRAEPWYAVSSVVRQLLIYFSYMVCCR